MKTQKWLILLGIVCGCSQAIQAAPVYQMEQTIVGQEVVPTEVLEVTEESEEDTLEIIEEEDALETTEEEGETLEITQETTQENVEIKEIEEIEDIEDLPVLVETIELQQMQEVLIAPEQKSIISYGEYAGIGQQIADQFYEGVVGLQENVYFKNYGITLDTFKDHMVEAAWEARNINANLIGNKVQIYKWGDTNINKYEFRFDKGAISSIELFSDQTIKINYNNTQIIESTTRELNEVCEQILAECSLTTTDIEKELIIHDYLILNGEYDYENYINDTIPEESYSAYGILVNKIGVCQSYAYAMKLLLREQDIPCDVVMGGGHAWNIVHIDGENYYVDTTWDDPVPDIEGRVSREHFNMTTSQNVETGHTWDQSLYPQCTSERYGFLQDINEWLYYDGIWFYTKDAIDEQYGYYISNNLYSYNEENQEEELLVEGSCTKIYLDKNKERIYYTKQGETSYCSIYGEQQNELIPFVNKFYTACLGRDGEQEGLEYWALQLLKGEQTGAQLAESFIYAPEFQEKNLDNKAYIEVMYAAFFGRTAEQEGLEYWVKELEKGVTRKSVLASFIASQEYYSLCAEYDITVGELVLTNPADIYIPITQFVYRFYQKTLNRVPDEIGLNYWVGQLQQGKLSGRDFAVSVLYSDEFLAKNLAIEEFLNILYQAFFDREGDSNGVHYWKECMQQGMSKETVVESFISSNEFEKICEEYGIQLN